MVSRVVDAMSSYSFLLTGTFIGSLCEEVLTSVIFQYDSTAQKQVGTEIKCRTTSQNWRMDVL